MSTAMRLICIGMCECECERENEVVQSCPTLCNPMDCSLPGSSIHGISQARVLEWVAIAFSILSSRGLQNIKIPAPA